MPRATRAAVTITEESEDDASDNRYDNLDESEKQ